MIRFTFTTTSTPQYAGQGVDWEDGRATYRISVDGAAYTQPINGATADMSYAYGGLPGYTYTELD